MGRTPGVAGRGGDPPDVDGCGRPPERLRPASHGGRGARGADPRDRLRRGGDARAPGRGARRGGSRGACRDAVSLSRHHAPRGAGLPRRARLPSPAVNPLYHPVYKVGRRIPPGRVATYGVVARLAGQPGQARTVGWALAERPGAVDVPWWRVINAAGPAP